MITLTPKQRRELRAQAHSLHPVVSVGQQGLTPQVMHEIDISLRAHALVKVRVFSEDRAERESMLSQIAGELEAAPVQHLGKVLIVWRPIEEPKPPVKPKARSTKTAKRPATNAKRTAKTAKRTTELSRVRKTEGKTPPDDTARTSRTPRASFGRSAPNPRRRRRAV